MTLELPKYRSHKVVQAIEIKQITMAEADGHSVIHCGEPGYPAQITVDNEVFTRYMPVPGDFLVVYGDGYQSVSPRKNFLEGYTRADGDQEAAKATSSQPMAFANGLTREEDDAIDDLTIDIVRIATAVEKLGRHRSYSVAVTKLDEARHWLRDRKHRAP